MAVGDRIWQRQAFVDLFASKHNDQLLAASVSSNERLERVVAEVYVNVVSQDSAVLSTWLTYGVLVVAHWQPSETGTPVDPGDIGDADLSQLDVLTSQYARMGPAETFTNWHHVPANEDTIALDTNVTRRPPPGGTGFVWLMWGLPTFTGAGVEVGAAKALVWTLTTQVAP